MGRIIVVGNSHMIALQAAPKRDGMYLLRLMRNKAGGVVIGDVSLEEAVDSIKKSPDCVVVSALGGNQHQMFLLEHPQPFDFFEPGDEELSPGHELIPHGVMYDVFARGIVKGNDGTQMLALRKAAPGPMYHLEVPPPKADEQHMRKRVEGNFREGVAAGRPFTKASIRAKLWRLQQKVTRDFCEASNIKYVGAPSIAKDAGDFLKPEYYAPDATHANAAYGALVLDQIEALVAR